MATTIYFYFLFTYLVSVILCYEGIKYTIKVKGDIYTDSQKKQLPTICFFPLVNTGLSILFIILFLYVNREKLRFKK